MKHFIVDIVITCSFILIFGVAWQCYYSHTRKNNYQYKYEYLNTHADEIKILLLGNSHFENSLNSNLLGDSVFNAATSGRWIYYDCCLLEKYIESMSNLRTVIFSMGYKMPVINYHNHPLEDDDKMYIRNHEIFMHISYDRFPEKILYSSPITVRTVLGTDKHIDCDTSGYELLPGQKDDWKNEQNVSPTLYKNNKNLSKDTSDYAYYLARMAKICQSRNIRFIVVTTPCHDVYLNNTESLGHQVRYDIIGRVQRKYPLEYFDYLEDKEYRADSLYYNCSHLNHDGSSKFAIRLKRDLSL